MSKSLKHQRDFVAIQVKRRSRFKSCTPRTLIFLPGLLLAAAVSVAEPRVQTFVYKREHVKYTMRGQDDSAKNNLTEKAN